MDMPTLAAIPVDARPARASVEGRYAWRPRLGTRTL